jgi:transposase
MVKSKLPFRRKRFTELTDSQWEIIKDFLQDTRKRKHCLRVIANAILKVTRTGTQWRNMDEKYPPWQSVYYYFRKWQKEKTWSSILSYLVEKERIRQNRNPKASVAAVDSQSVKIGSFICLDKGFDGGKKVNGRKRHLAVDVLGLPLAIHVSAADVHDGQGGFDLLWQIEKASDRMEIIRGDGHYKGLFSEYAAYYKWTVEVTKKPESQKGFVPQIGRWQVERSFGWFNYFRRLSRDFEKTVESAAAFIKLAFIDIILSRFPN